MTGSVAHRLSPGDQPTVDLEIRALCDSLRSAREAKGMSLADVSRITRIPKTSLCYLEEGSFDSIPADVFVRGFLRAYSSCVGINPDETVARYAACGQAAVESALREEAAATLSVAEDTETVEPSARTILLPPRLETEAGSKRGSYTLAVIILMVVATLTMSYLLREPAYNVDGVTQNETTIPVDTIYLADRTDVSPRTIAAL